MYGGWGPHLGHLVRATDDALWFVDDACEPGSCGVGSNTRLDYYRLEDDRWTRVASQALPPYVQQNTGTIFSEGRFWTYGIDVGNQKLVECDYRIADGRKRCWLIAIPLPANTNYVGAARSPNGYRMTWATTVGAGDGRFHWFADYGGGWSGPRTNYVGGYNDASYIHMAFFGGAKSDHFVMHGQLVSGAAPSWGFVPALANGNVASGNAVTWRTVFTPPPGEAVMSTNDIAIDPQTDDIHVFARMRSGAAAYYHQAGPRGSLSTALWWESDCHRARIVNLRDGSLALACGTPQGTLRVRIAPPDRAPGVPVDWANLEVITIPLGESFGQVFGIYPENSLYQEVTPETLELAVVGSEHENEVVHVSIRP
jgi:hypothetical protein